MGREEALQQYLELYRTHATLLARHSCAPLNAQRAAAYAALEKGGLPTRKVERYRYTDVAPALEPNYGLNLRRQAPDGDPVAAYRCRVRGIKAWTRYVINDIVVPQSAGEEPLPGGAYAGSLCAYEQENPGFIAKYYHTAARRDYDALCALNTLLVQDGLLIYIPPGVRFTQPLQIVNVSSGDENVMSNRRVLLVAGQGAKATVLVCDHSFGTGRYLTTEVTEAFIGAGAKVDIYTVEQTNARNARFSCTFVEQEAESRVVHGSLTLQGGLTRNRTDVHLSGADAALEAYGAVVADGTEHVDNNLLVNHDAPRCTSDMLYKYVLDGRSVGAFAGKVLVQPRGQQARSQETNANLCAAPGARAYAQPMLEIYADDVRCNHGSTVGKLDETALFYMRQRGIPEAEARLLLQHAFINEVLRHIRVAALRERLAELVALRFRRSLPSCDGCDPGAKRLAAQ